MFEILARARSLKRAELKISISRVDKVVSIMKVSKINTCSRLNLYWGRLGCQSCVGAKHHSAPPFSRSLGFHSQKHKKKYKRSARGNVQATGERLWCFNAWAVVKIIVIFPSQFSDSIYTASFRYFGGKSKATTGREPLMTFIASWMAFKKLLTCGDLRNAPDVVEWLY